MKELKLMIFAVLFLTLSCCEERETGVCYGCYDSYVNYVCKTDVMRKECAEWDKEKRNGCDWTFEEGEDAICLPLLPERE
ncbi:hypothetical protein ACFLU5_11855 [Bacteroidota bacterium]